MSEENQNQSNLPKKITELPGNYYFDGNPSRVIDRVADLAKLDGDPYSQDERYLLAREVLSFCPVLFLDELIEALILNTQEAIKKLRDKASHNEINLHVKNYSEEEKNQISALALKLLREKIISADSEQILAILRFVQEYIRVQISRKDSFVQETTKLQNEKDQLAEKIRIKGEEFVEDQKAVFFDFLQKLSQEDF
ncbi:MAG: hypothetical protein GX943_01690 [Candidatus Pacebacteria bacterium]|jgi:hypothetical protein|nr:hypothetical protein [Candidatus Paceibacterota bacterium]